MARYPLYVCVALVCLLCGCGVPEITGPACDGKVCTTDVAEGKRTIVDATDKEAWIFFSFATGKQVEVSDPGSSKEWDLGFRRVEIKSNGGVSGSGGVKVAILKETTLDKVSKAPEASAFTSDKADEDNDGTPDHAFLQEDHWYNYDLGTHLLSPKQRVFVVLATDGKHYKVQMHSYYSNDKTSGFPSFTWAPLDTK